MQKKHNFFVIAKWENKKKDYFHKQSFPNNKKI